MLTLSWEASLVGKGPKHPPSLLQQQKGNLVHGDFAILKNTAAPKSLAWEGCEELATGLNKADRSSRQGAHEKHLAIFFSAWQKKIYLQ